MSINYLKNNTIVVTGGAGSIGSTLVRMLLELSPKEIIILDDLSSGSKEFIPKNKLIKFIHVDISNSEKLSKCIPNNTNYIFHLAAHFANLNSIANPITDISTNLIGTINLLEISKKLKNLKKFINCSSSCVYGGNPDMSLNSKLYPTTTPYAINKLTGELYSRFYFKNFGVPTISIRIFNTYGKYESPGKFRNVITNFINLAINNKPITITGTGNETRDFTYSEDTCRLLLLAALSDIADGSAFNGGTGNSTKIIDLANRIIHLSKSKSEIVFLNQRKWDDVKDRLSDISETKNKLKYMPTNQNLDENLNEIISWQKNILN